jgi:hypothetical protein
VITVSEEKVVDYETTARIATAAFGSSEVVFAASRMKWLHERAFGQAALAANTHGRWIEAAKTLRIEVFRLPENFDKGASRRFAVRLQHPGSREWVAMGRRGFVQLHRAPDIAVRRERS